MLLAGGTVVAGGGVLEPGWIEVDGDRLTAVEAGSPPRPADVDLAGRVVVPGFVDVHVHGGGGASYTSSDPAEVLRAVDLHRRHGTTTTLASLVTADLDVLERQVRVLAELVADGVLAGIHLEGPWLSATHRGAHDPALLRAPERGEVRRLLKAGGGAIRMVTLAPELEGGHDAVREVVAAGAVAAVGHSDASYDRTVAAIGAGATVATHLYNAMRPLHHREPGPIVALLEDPRVAVELIADGVHLHPAALRHAATAGPERTMLVTDAMSAAGSADGDYLLGGLEVRVTGGVARLVAGGAIAGSTLTMDAALRHVVSVVGLSLPDAVRAACTNPAKALGLPGVGDLRAGGRADLALLDTDLGVLQVMRAGKWVS